jgi:hypothetical protein
MFCHSFLRMHNNHLSRLAALLAAIALLPGCASIISGRYADISIASNPTGAHVAIRDDANQEVASFHTPGVAKLKRNRKFLMPARYTATIDAPGYQAAQVPIRSTANPWILANVVLGGLPGLIVDSATGAVYQPTPSRIHQELSPIHGQQTTIQPASHQQDAPADAQ